MPGTLTFPIDDDLRKLVEHARTSPSRNATYAELYDGRCRRDGRDHEGDDFPTSDDVDPARIPVGLWLVKDDGVYLMSPGQPPLPDPAGRGNLTVYALEANPKDDDCYDNARFIMGGDDGVDKIDLDVFEQAIAASATKVVVNVTPEALEVRFFR